MTNSTAYPENFLPPAERQFFGPGSVCGLLQITPGQLRVLMEDTGTTFAACLDGVPMLDANGLQRVVDKAAEIRAEIAGKIQATPNN